MSLNVNINIDTKKLMANINASCAKATMAVANQVLKDSNYYVPVDTSMLQKSAIIHSNTSSNKASVEWGALPRNKNGDITYNTSYAAAQYYGEHFDHSKQRNTNATHHWFEVAKQNKLKDWIELAKKFF